MITSESQCLIKNTIHNALIGECNINLKLAFYTLVLFYSSCIFISPFWHCSASGTQSILNTFILLQLFISYTSVFLLGSEELNVFWKIFESKVYRDQRRTNLLLH